MFSQIIQKKQPPLQTEAGINQFGGSLEVRTPDPLIKSQVLYRPDYIISDLAVIDSKGIPDIPTLLIISDGTITDGWIDFEMDYASKLSDVTTVQLNCRHSVFDYEPDSCEKSMREFLNQVER